MSDDKKRDPFEAWLEADKDVTYPDSLAVARAAWKAALATVPKWLSVEDRLPEPDSRVLATGWDCGQDGGPRHYVVAVFGSRGFVEDEEWSEPHVLQYITHWMPLPAAPKART